MDTTISEREAIPARIDRLPMSREIWGIMLLAGIAWLVESYDVGVIGSVLPSVVKEFHLGAFSEGLLAIASTLGIVVAVIPDGIADRVVPYNGSGRRQLPSILVWLQGWATRDGCTTGPTVFYTQGNVTGLEWTHCQGNAIIVHFRIQGEGHTWPSVRFNVSFNASGGTAGTTGQALSASALIWSFFQQHPLGSQ